MLSIGIVKKSKKRKIQKRRLINMPLGKNIRYKFKKTSAKSAVRLAFRKNKVVEVTPYIKKN